MLWGESHAFFKQCYKMPFLPFDEDNDHNPPINLDGFGIGFLNKNKFESYTNIIPAWNDKNFKLILNLIESPFFLAHIRATCRLNTLKQRFTPVHCYNCHPFLYENTMFCCNGIIQSFSDGVLKKKWICDIDDKLLVEIKGTTDSEYLFYLLLSYMKSRDTILAIEDALKFLNSLDEKLVICINFVLIQDKMPYIVRYMNKKNQKPPSLYLKQDILSNEFIVSSEPLNNESKIDEWKLIEKNTVTYINNNNLKTIKL